MVAGEEDRLQIDEVADLRRDCPAQLVVIEDEVLQIGEVTQFRRYRAVQLVVGKRELLQVSEVAQLRWYLTRSTGRERYLAERRVRCRRW